VLAFKKASQKKKLFFMLFFYSLNFLFNLNYIFTQKNKFKTFWPKGF